MKMLPAKADDDFDDPSGAGLSLTSWDAERLTVGVAGPHGAQAEYVDLNEEQVRRLRDLLNDVLGEGAAAPISDAVVEAFAEANYYAEDPGARRYTWRELHASERERRVRIARNAHSQVPRFLALLPQTPAAESAPISMILHCPKCGLQHVDAPVTISAPAYGLGGVVIGQRTVAAWTNPPHRSHLCHGCGHIWRPADVPTEGVQAITTKGKADSPSVDSSLRDGWPDADVERGADAVREIMREHGWIKAATTDLAAEMVRAALSAIGAPSEGGGRVLARIDAEIARAGGDEKRPLEYRTYPVPRITIVALEMVKGWLSAPSEEGGWVLVPREGLTDIRVRMKQWLENSPGRVRGDLQRWADSLAAMLAAAPSEVKE